MKQITCPHCGDTYPDFDAAHVCSKGPYAPKLKSKMNERIKELALQCGAWHQVYDNKQFMVDGNFDVEKFARLIIEDCIDVVKPTQHHEAYAQSYFGGVDGLDLLINKVYLIKQHFKSEN